MKAYSAQATLTQEEIIYVNKHLRDNGCIKHASGILEVTVNLEGETHRLTLNGNQLIAETSAKEISGTKCVNHTWLSLVKRLRWVKNFSTDQNLWLPLAGITVAQHMSL